ncbi:MAG: hypothetical protein JJU05_07010 [Verrucomicrobia bacterium]|nr:hypothetical protein [Verrucomicrobiota bacterium]MCH8526046.1 hypothetical protein [Kiritimatiellia bacterium]
MSISFSPRREPVLIFLHSPAALRVEFNLDTSTLHLWPSPGAGGSPDARARDFSNRDVHLEVFEAVTLPGCGLADFEGCEYDPWHTELRFSHQVLHLAVSHDAAELLVWAEAPQAVEVVTALTDTVRLASDRVLRVEHSERGKSFCFALRGPEGLGLRHSPKPSPGNKVYSRGVLPPGRGMVMGLDPNDPTDRSDPTDQPDLTEPDPRQWLERTGAWLAPMVAAGRLRDPAYPVLETMRRLNQRGLASMVDHSGTVRASIKSIYYLIWIRDAVFAAAGCVAGGWPHRLEKLCEVLLSNPCHAKGPGVPEGRMFAQLIHPDGGKYEEDGIFYVLWAVFSHWSQTGSDRFVSGGRGKLLREAVDWVDRRCFDAERGLYGGHFADETPAWGSRDHGWDYVTGKPLDGGDHIRAAGGPVTRSYDIYINTLMHSVWSMWARMTADSGAQARADALWEGLRDFYEDRKDGLPAYGDLVLRDGGEERVYAWGPVSSVYVWALTLPNFLPLEDKDEVLAVLLKRLAAEPGMHWNNGLCAAVAACDPWVNGEADGVSLLVRISEDAMKPGPWHPMGGAMPEKFDAPQGNLYHDIRPQAFAMGAWLGALASFGLRRLPHGLALRPTGVYGGIGGHEAFGRTFDVDFTPETDPVLRINSELCPHSLQVPEALLCPGHNALALGGRPVERPLLLRSDVKLISVEVHGERICYTLEAFGSAELVFEGELKEVCCVGDDGGPLDMRVTPREGRRVLRFRAAGRVAVSVNKHDGEGTG